MRQRTPRRSPAIFDTVRGSSVTSAEHLCWNRTQPERAQGAAVVKNEPDGAAEHVQQVFDLPLGLRIATVTGCLAELDRRLTDARYASLPLATDLRHQIRSWHDEEVPG